MFFHKYKASTSISQDYIIVKAEEEVNLFEQSKSVISDKLISDIKLYGYSTKENINIELLNTNIRALVAYKDGILGIGGVNEKKSKILYYSNDGCQTWDWIQEFSNYIKAIHIDSKDNIFISTGEKTWTDECKSEIYLMEDLKSNKEKVLDIKSGVVLNWNIASDNDGYMFISEYGYKNMEDNPRRIYRSKDYGKTWDIAYDPKKENGYHNHIIHIDVNNPDNIYQVIGDDNKRILKSSDRGDTWNVVDRNYHPTSVYQVGKHLLYGLDGYPFGGFKVFDMIENKAVKDIKLNYKGSFYDIEKVGEDLFATMLSYESHNWPGIIYRSKDNGKTWEEYIIFNRPDNIGVGIDTITYDDENIYLSGGFPAYIDGKLMWHEGTIKINR